MTISNEVILKRRIDELKVKTNLHSRDVIYKLKTINGIIDPVYQATKVLPKQEPFGKVINRVLDETILDSALLFSNKFKGDSSSVLKIAGNNVIENAIKMIVKNNTLRIKIYGVAILKNIFS